MSLSYVITLVLNLNFYFSKFTVILHIEKIVTSEKKIILGNYTGALTLSCTFSTPAMPPRVYSHCVHI